MRRVLLIALTFLLAVISVAAAPVTFTTSLSGPAEEPPNNSTGTGLATVIIDPVAHTLSVSLSFADLVAGSTASHIHVINGPGDTNTADTTGPVATTTPFFPGFPLGVTSGTYQNTFDTTLASTYRPGWITDAGSIAAAESALFAGITEGRAYLNIHSNTYPGGEIRGFLEAASVPEPSTFALIGTGFGSLVLWRRKRT